MAIDDYHGYVMVNDDHERTTWVIADHGHRRQGIPLNTQ